MTLAAAESRRSTGEGETESADGVAKAAQSSINASSGPASSLRLSAEESPGSQPLTMRARSPTPQPTEPREMRKEASLAALLWPSSEERLRRRCLRTASATSPIDANEPSWLTVAGGGATSSSVRLSTAAQSRASSCRSTRNRERSGDGSSSSMCVFLVSSSVGRLAIQ